MCRYCKLDKYGNMEDNAWLVNKSVKGPLNKRYPILSLALSLYGDYDSEPRMDVSVQMGNVDAIYCSIPVKFCPVCGRNLLERK